MIGEALPYGIEITFCFVHVWWRSGGKDLSIIFWLERLMKKTTHQRFSVDKRNYSKTRVKQVEKKRNENESALAMKRLICFKVICSKSEIFQTRKPRERSASCSDVTHKYYTKSSFAVLFKFILKLVTKWQPCQCQHSNKWYCQRWLRIYWSEHRKFLFSLIVLKLQITSLKVFKYMVFFLES